MCGMAGWVDYDRDLTLERDTALAMTRTMALRGPDAEGLWIDSHVALGHRRLAVIDPRGGGQPMSEGPVTLVYSGETYNFRELRKVLEFHGHRFRTRSDTEVVLRAYLHWGSDLVEHLNGMYAFALWDRRTEELLLVRDRMGIKPLYYAPTRHGVLFGSEPKAILANPLFTPRLRDEGLFELLTTAKTPGHAVFDGMYEVEPGHVVRVSREGVTDRRYWALTAREHTDGIPRTVRRVRELLEDIVERQLISDVPLCTMLSGGLDSSALTALADRAMGLGTVRTFAVDFTDEGGGFVPDAMRDTSDTPYVHDVAKHVGSHHTDVVLSGESLSSPEAVEQVMRARDLPGIGDMDTSLYLLFAEIRRHSTVALSGESADEVFGGYRWFHDPAAVAADTFPWLHGLGRVTDLVDRDLDRRTDAYVAERYRQAIDEVPRLPGEDGLERRMREICHLHLTRMVRFLLDRKDRLSMAVGLEVRVPFCDHRLVEYVFNTPWAYKTYDGREKSLLRGAVADLLPASVVRRRKSPYPATQNPSYERSVRDRLSGILADPNAPVRPYLDVKAARAALRRPIGRASLQENRTAMERIVGLNDWLTAYRPEHV
ncbi:asparagine synthase (glutamine-hydrolyzing) [Actinoallomurus rhizosphaericola]|uniref:asparagine synthase (glutamine-hydrolyzing) n=1 Tax=Actinoallomurus rhizosphaericola TaxID=2952536 RepID=UPI002090D6E7|nr:asparagine synthase (glutamine-hydrolyzing) [Actinoallomurus rhizosphaericola]MCO5994574.1 asparagine synthase (glutamine-hydrolyzing) [Actinoallomurus rhizosphaericola]